MKRCFLLFCVLLVFISCLTRVCLAASETEAAAAIASTRQKVASCYQSVSEADSAGANVTGLLSVLNEAGLLLSKADLAYGRREYDSAHAYAISGLERLGSFEIEARDLREAALQHGYWDFTLNIVGSLVGAVAVMIAGFAVWFWLRRRYSEGGKWGQTNLREYRALFLVVTAVVALFVASPMLSRVLVYPRTEFFSEMWLLGPNHKAEGYPFNVSRGQNYTVFLGIGNQLGYCAYYVVEVKFRNETEPVPARFGPVEDRTPSSVPSLFNVSAFVADEQDWELPLSFSFDYEVSLDRWLVMFQSLALNNEVLSLEDHVAAWNATRGVFFGNLVFELWIYNAQATALSYHGRFVDLKLNMTVI